MNLCIHYILKNKKYNKYALIRIIVELVLTRYIKPAVRRRLFSGLIDAGGLHGAG